MTLKWLPVDPSTIPEGAQGMVPSEAFAADTSIGRVYVLGCPESEDSNWYVYGPSWRVTPTRRALRAFRTTQKAFAAIERETAVVARGAT